MLQTTEQLAGLPVPTPEMRALRVAEFITTVVATHQTPSSLTLPLHSAYTFVIDDPTGRFPLEVVDPTRLRFAVGQQGISRVYAVSSYHDPRHDEVARLRLERRDERDEATRKLLRASALALARKIPKPRQFTFRHSDLTHNWRIIRPVTAYPDLQPYGKM